MANNSEEKAAAQKVEAQQTEKRVHKDGIDVYKTDKGVYVVQQWQNGQGGPARAIGKEDREAYFTATKGASKEVVEQERAKLYDKYLSPEAEARRAEAAAQRNAAKGEQQAKPEVKPLAEASAEVKARISNVSMFDGKEGNKMLRASIDGAAPVFKPVKGELLSSYFMDAKSGQVSKEEWAERRTNLAAAVFSKELSAPKQEESQSKGIGR